MIRSHQPAAVSSDFFRQPLIDMINQKHPLVKLATVSDGDEIGQSFGVHFESRFGRPALSPRLVAGLLYLQHAYDCSTDSRLLEKSRQHLVKLAECQTTPSFTS